MAHLISTFFLPKMETLPILTWGLILPGPVFKRKLCLSGGGRSGFDLPLSDLFTSRGRWVWGSLTRQSAGPAFICDRAMRSRTRRMNLGLRRGRGGDRGDWSTWVPWSDCSILLWVLLQQGFPLGLVLWLSLSVLLTNNLWLFSCFLRNTLFLPPSFLPLGFSFIRKAWNTPLLPVWSSRLTRIPPQMIQLFRTFTQGWHFCHLGCPKLFHGFSPLWRYTDLVMVHRSWLSRGFLNGNLLRTKTRTESDIKIHGNCNLLWSRKPCKEKHNLSEHKCNPSICHSSDSGSQEGVWSPFQLPWDKSWRYTLCDV